MPHIAISVNGIGPPERLQTNRSDCGSNQDDRVDGRIDEESNDSKAYGRRWVALCTGEEVAGTRIGTEGGMVIGHHASTTTVNDTATLECRVHLKILHAVDGDATPNHSWYSTRGNPSPFPPMIIPSNRNYGPPTLRALLWVESADVRPSIVRIPFIFPPIAVVGTNPIFVFGGTGLHPHPPMCSVQAQVRDTGRRKLLITIANRLDWELQHQMEDWWCWGVGSNEESEYGCGGEAIPSHSVVLVPRL
ncbi:hypothetical protein EV421DRAFT_2016502 [Armillaria borealis]|uniref:Uncharacterized protein n=1 Tax=Armillaria borealis TaxID=47425 RepID=A0AA39JZ25_9AGAR|nr:hypothetical protein EV421DRAFT_2016502 [Armillaria borealis]